MNSPRIASAPGRANLMGEHTDYNGGRCLPIALPLRTTARVTPRSDRRIRISSESMGSWQGDLTDLRPGAVPGWPAYAAAAVAVTGPTQGVDVQLSSTVPTGAGLSSSAAVICAVARAMSNAINDELVVPCIEAETEQVGAPTGGLDQTVSLLARAGHALRLDFATGERRHVLWQPETRGIELVIVDTRTRHTHATGEYTLRRSQCERAAELLRLPWLAGATEDALESLRGVHRQRARHVVRETARVDAVVSAVAQADWQRVGELFTASHLSLRDDFEVSCDQLDVAVDTALVAGALGARMTGGGFGGCVLVLTADPPRLRGLLREAFVSRGWLTPRFHSGTASAAASVDVA